MRCLNQRTVTVALAGRTGADRMRSPTSRSGELETGFGEIESACAAARDSLDQLQVSILDRQAQLQNYEDLASLQRHKLAVLE